MKASGAGLFSAAIQPIRRVVGVQKRKKYLRRALLGALVLLTAMAQHVPWLPVVSGVYALPLLPLVISIAALDQDISAIFFGAFAGLLWDCNTVGFGWNSLYLTTVAFAVAMLMRYVLNRNRLSLALLHLLAVSIYILQRWFLDYLLLALRPAAFGWLDTAASRQLLREQALRVLLRSALPSLLYTLLLAPLLYALVLLIVRRTSRKQRRLIEGNPVALQNI
ncbi:MAG: hypothetical protein LBG83_00130 [Oscillospiraceae bacterium]|jgi:hypothetical protein|nr:hypothetical protein [Oscillospiraceae bacterium]